MTKKEIIESLIENEGLSYSTAFKAVNGIIKAISGSLSGGESVYLRGLGTLKVTIAAQKTARDIKNKRPIIVPQRLRVKFIPGYQVKESLKK